MACVYILYSESLNCYYIGSCRDFTERLVDHQSGKYKASYTAKTTDWRLYFLIDKLGYSQARKLEAHIKRMKSRSYIESLNRREDLIEFLKDKYS